MPSTSYDPKRRRPDQHGNGADTGRHIARAREVVARERREGRRK